MQKISHAAYFHAKNIRYMEEQYFSTAKRHPVRAIFGFLFTMIMTVLLITNGFLTALNVSVLKGNDLNSILENVGFYDTIRSAIVTELSDESLGLSVEALETILPDELMSETVDKITDSLLNDTAFDVAYIEDDCMDIAQTTSEALIDEAFDVIDSNSVFDVTTLSSVAAIADFEENYGVDITTQLEDAMISAFGTTTVDLSEYSTDEVKAKVSDTVSEAVNTVITEAFDRYTDVANEIANELIHKASSEYKLDEILENFDNALKAFDLAITILYVIIAAIFIIQLFMYLKKPAGAFKNLSVCTFITAACMFISCGFVGFIAEKLMEEFNSFDAAEKLVKDFFEANVDAVTGSIIRVGIVCTVVGVLSVVIAVLINRRNRSAVN